VNDAIIPKKRKVFGCITMTMNGEEDDIGLAKAFQVGAVLPDHPHLRHRDEAPTTSASSYASSQKMMQLTPA